MIRNLASWMIKHRYIVLGTMLAITIFFLFQISKITIKTELSDLLPYSHPFIKIHEKYEEQIGGSFKIFLMLQVKEGNIYNKETLEKIVRITDGLDAVPGVNHNQIYSIASRKLKKIKVTADAILTEDLMKEVPYSPSSMEEFKGTVRTAPGVFGVWVSKDEKAALFSAAFVERLMNVDIIFKDVGRLIEKESDKNHVVSMAGEPVLMGWVNIYRGEMWRIFGITFTLLLFILLIYFRNIAGTLVPFCSTILAAIWGLGITGLIGYNLEPLTLVVPLLITARSLSHSVQITERYFEFYNEMKDVKKACIECMSSNLPPGIVGIATDAIGIVLMAVAPIPIIQKVAYMSVFWACSNIFSGLIFAPILLSFFPPPCNIPEIVNTERGATHKVLGYIAKAVVGRGAVVILICGITIAVFAGIKAYNIGVGDVHPGSPILWPDSNYNMTIAGINKNFPGTEELYVIVEGEGPRAVESPGFLRILNSFQRHMEKSTLSHTQSISDLLPAVYRNIYGGHPKLEAIPLEKKQTAQVLNLLLTHSAPGDYDVYFSRDGSNASIIIWYKDHMGETLRKSIASVKKFVEENKEALAKEKCNIRLASGNLGVLAAINETVEDSQFLNFILVVSSVFLITCVTFRSFFAPLIIMIPLNLANIISMAIMSSLEIGLNINTLPIVSLGMGLGDDYAIYLLSRLCEEFQSTQGPPSMAAVVRKSIMTTGKAIFFTATTMVVSVIPWYFLSSTRFTADMGLILAVIMIFNMLGALFFLPALVSIFKPKLLGRVRLLIKE